MTYYGLRMKDTGKVIGVSASSNGDRDFCNDITFTLSINEYNVWMVAEKSVAEKVSITSTEWYNAEYYSPENPYVGKCEIFTVEV